MYISPLYCSKRSDSPAGTSSSGPSISSDLPLRSDRLRENQESNIANKENDSRSRSHNDRYVDELISEGMDYLLYSTVVQAHKLFYLLVEKFYFSAQFP